MVLWQLPLTYWRNFCQLCLAAPATVQAALGHTANLWGRREPRQEEPVALLVPPVPLARAACSIPLTCLSSHSLPAAHLLFVTVQQGMLLRRLGAWPLTQPSLMLLTGPSASLDLACKG